MKFEGEEDKFVGTESDPRSLGVDAFSSETMVRVRFQIPAKHIVNSLFSLGKCYI